MTQTTAIFGRPSGSFEAVRDHGNSPIHIDRILERLSCLELPGQEHFENYLRHKSRVNHKPRTINSSFTSIMLFLDFYGKSGKRGLEEIERSDLEAFIEYEQDRGMHISTVRPGWHPSSPFSISLLNRISSADHSSREESD